MPDVKRTVEILFLGNDEVSKTIKSVSAALGEFDVVIQGVAQPMARVGDTILQVDTALAALAVGGMALAIREASAFETSFNEISTLMDASAKDIGEFREQVLNYATGSTQSIESINKAVYSAISAGIDYKTVLGSLNDAEKLSVAGKADLNSTILVLASTLNAYGASTDKASQYANALFTTVKLGQTTLPELSSALAQVTGIAVSANVPIEDLTAAVAALTVAGLPTSQAMTGLKQVISSILAPGAEAEKLFAQLGVQYGKSALEAKGLDGVLAEMQTATKGNADQMKTLLGGVEGLNAGLILAADKSGKYAQALEAMRSGQDVVTAAFEKMADTIKNINQTLANNVDILLIQVGDRMTSGYKDVAGGITDIFRAMQESVKNGAFDKLFALIDEFSADLTKFLKNMASSIPEAFEKVNFDKLIDALKDLGREFGMLFDDIDLDTPEGLADAIQGAVDTLESLVRVTQGMVEYFEPLWDSITEGIDRFNDLSEAEKRNAGEMLGAAELVAKLGTAVGGALVVIQKSGADIENVYNAVIGSVTAGWNTLQVAFDQIMIMGGELVSKLLWVAEKGTLVGKIFGSDLSDDIATARQEIEGFVDSAKQNQFENMTELIDGASQAWSGLTGEIEKTPDEKTTEWTSEIDPKTEGLIDWSKHPDVQALIVTEADESSALDAQKTIEQAIPPKQDTTIAVHADKESVENTKEYILKQLETQSDVLKTGIEWKAKVDIAEVESATQIFTSAIDSVNIGLGETTKMMTEAFSALSSDSFAARWEAQQTLDAEQDYRKQEFDLQKKLTEEQIKLQESKRRALEQGKGLITITADGLEQHLQMILYEVIQKVQILANEEASEMLLGV